VAQALTPPQGPSATRRLFLDRSPGELRGVVTLGGRPERLLIEREGEEGLPRLGERWRGRIRRRLPHMGGAFLDLGSGPDALLKGAANLPEGAAVEVEITAEARAGKGPAAVYRGQGSGPPERLERPPPLIERLRAFAPQAPVAEGGPAREAADLAEAAVLQSSFRIARGALLTIERTRALVAVDVDLGEGSGPRAAVGAANIDAVREAARLLRLKGLGGVVVIDLVGRPGDPAAIKAAARAAFAPDEPGVVYGEISRSGVLEIAKPHREAPLIERLCDADGRLSARTMAQRLARRLLEEGRADPGGRLLARAAPEVIEAARQLEPGLAETLGARFRLEAGPSLGRHEIEVGPL
jgi:Ribonuclease G/E